MLFIIPMYFLLFSCASTKNIAYFESDRDTAFSFIVDTVEAPIQKNDLLNINISSLNKAASADFNMENNNEKGYLVDNEGNIQMPTLGNVAAEGLTKSQLKDKITKSILDKGLLLDPIVEVRHLNFEVTVLGEVNRPAVITVPSEQISLVKALGLAGDLTIYGRRENILLIREENGRRSSTRLNINSVDFLNSPYYYLRDNDMIYVEPNKTKIASTDRTLVILPIVLSTVSILLLTVTTIINL
jgi:polysaccharide biosynthesis/export protein